jgi:hypothetical protein
MNDGIDPKAIYEEKNIVVMFIFMIWRRRVLDEKSTKVHAMIEKHRGSCNNFKVLDTRQHDWNLFCILHSYIFLLKFMLIFVQFRCCIHKHIHIMTCYIDRPDVP